MVLVYNIRKKRNRKLDLFSNNFHISLSKWIGSCGAYYWEIHWRFLFSTLSDWETLTLGFLFTLQYEDFSQTRIPVLTKAVFAVFAILVPILLLNMLIAMMGNTYQQIISRSEKEWRRQVSSIFCGKHYIDCFTTLPLPTTMWHLHTPCTKTE